VFVVWSRKRYKKTTKQNEKYSLHSITLRGKAYRVPVVGDLDDRFSTWYGGKWIFRLARFSQIENELTRRIKDEWDLVWAVNILEVLKLWRQGQ
jgi:hypothetical protein